MKRILLILCVVSLFGCEDYLDFLKNINQPPVIKLQNSAGSMVTEMSAKLKLPSTIKSHRADFYTIEGNVMDPEGQLKSVRGVTKAGSGSFSEPEINSNGVFRIYYTPDYDLTKDFENHVIDVLAEDNLGNISKATINLEVFVNKKPSASFTLQQQPDRATWLLDATASNDPDEADGGGITALKWTIKKSGGATVSFTDLLLNDNGEFDGIRKTYFVFSEGGTYEITLIAVDNDGGESVKVEKSENITIQ